MTDRTHRGGLSDRLKALEARERAIEARERAAEAKEVHAAETLRCADIVLARAEAIYYRLDRLPLH
jgi:hypothetical protein